MLASSRVCSRDDQYTISGTGKKISKQIINGFGNKKESDRMNDPRSTNVKKSNIVGGKGRDNGEQIETRRTRVERKTFLNGDAGTGKEGKDQTRATQSKENKD
jgi:hypothetical protein